MPFLDKNQPELTDDQLEKLTEEGQQTDADPSAGSVLKDMVDAVSLELSEMYADLELARKTTSLKNADLVSEEALSQIALNFDVLRTDATHATGTVTFRAKNVPTSDITIPSGTVVQTYEQDDGTIIKYSTTEAVTLKTTATKNNNTGFFEVDASVKANNAGTDQHVGANSLVAIPNRIAGIDSVTNNEPINNGTDTDSNSTLASNIRAKTLSAGIGTAPKYESLIEDNFDVDGVDLIGPKNTDNKRAQFGNEVDVPVIVENGTSFTTTLTQNGTDETIFTDTRPVKTVTSVVGTTNGTNYQSGVDYGFKQDTGPVFGRSAKSFDALTWFPNKIPGLGVKLTVQGTYNKTVKDIQDFLDDPTRRYLTGDLLVKEGSKVLVDITATITADSGVDRTQLKTDVESALSEAINNYELGRDVQEDDLVQTIESVEGVDSVSVPLTVLKKSTDSSTAGSTITISALEYARPGTFTLTVN